jgi:hypothetical protein
MAQPTVCSPWTSRPITQSHHTLFSTRYDSDEISDALETITSIDTNDNTAPPNE